LLSPRDPRLPSPQTLVDHLNAVFNATWQAILDAQLQDCLTEKLDDFMESKPPELSWWSMVPHFVHTTAAEIRAVV